MKAKLTKSITFVSLKGNNVQLAAGAVIDYDPKMQLGQIGGLTFDVLPEEVTLLTNLVPPRYHKLKILSSTAH